MTAENNITLLPMLPSEYQNGGKNLMIRYYYTQILFGEMLLAWTERGLCYAAFDDDQEKALKELQVIFPNATYLKGKESQEFPDSLQTLHVKGTDFQIQVWNELLRIPMGELTTYSTIAKRIGRPRACRAVGSAVGANPISLYVPCHRVIRATGEYGEYHWGSERKRKMIEWEKQQASQL